MEVEPTQPSGSNLWFEHFEVKRYIVEFNNARQMPAGNERSVLCDRLVQEGLCKQHNNCLTPSP